jgi:FkbM family methyltransferase
MARRTIEVTARDVVREALDRAEILFRRALRRPIVVRVGPYTMEAPSDMFWAFRGGAYYEKGMTRWLPLLMAEAACSVFFDVGANYGYYSLLLATCADEVHAFEPVTSTLSVLQTNLVCNQVENVQVHRTALSDSTGTETMHLFSSSGNNSFYDTEHGFAVRDIGSEPVPVNTLDQMIYEEGLPVPGLIKIDVEGAELHVLRGARRLLTEHHPMLTVEFSESHFRTAGYSRADIVNELTSNGYEIFVIPKDASGQLRPIDEGNIDNVVAVDAQVASIVLAIS